MFVRLVYESFRRQTRRKLLIAIAVTLGATVCTAMIGIALGIGDKINRETRVYGANIIVTPADDSLDVQIGSVDLKPAAGASFLDETSLPKIKGIFWRNNIAAFTPELAARVHVNGADATLLGTYFAKRLSFGKEQFTEGARAAFPWWKVQGAWPGDDSQDVLVGETLASATDVQPGSELNVNGTVHQVSGILSTGGAEDDQIVASLAVAQQVAGKPGAVGKIFVSAVTKPEDAFARRNPDTLSPADRDRWYCSPYPQSIAYQLQEAIPHSRAEQIRQVAQNEGNILKRISGLVLLITFAALLTSGLAVSAAMATAMFERRAEVGVMKALGAGHLTIFSIFMTESVMLACLGGVAGFAFGAVLTREIGRAIFGSNINVEPVLLLLILGISIGVTFGGSALAIRRAVRYDPVLALRGEA